ncbi:MAG: mechanosensitive ion channel family protein [Bacillota bacterium]|nr:mechanosensitive ion channel family protein [Bacillota bacterium]
MFTNNAFFLFATELASGIPHPRTWLVTDSWLAVAVNAGILLAVFLLRKPLAHFVIRLLGRPVWRRHPELREEARRDLVRPLAWLITAAALHILLPFSFHEGRLLPLLTRLTRSLTQIPFFWLLYQTARTASQLLLQSDKDRGREELSAFSYVSTMLRTLIAIIGVLVVLSNWIQNLSGIIAGLGIGGLLLALAAQDTASNIFAGLAIMLDRPFRIGDWINAGSDITGCVVEVGLRSTRIRQLDQSILTVPNSKLGSSPIRNISTRNALLQEIFWDLPLDLPPERVEGLLEESRAVLAELPLFEPEAAVITLDSFSTKALADANTVMMMRVRIFYKAEPKFPQVFFDKERVNLALLGPLQRALQKEEE